MSGRGIRKCVHLKSAMQPVKYKASVCSTHHSIPWVSDHIHVAPPSYIVVRHVFTLLVELVELGEYHTNDARLWRTGWTSKEIMCSLQPLFSSTLSYLKRGGTIGYFGSTNSLIGCLTESGSERFGFAKGVLKYLSRSSC